MKTRLYCFVAFLVVISRATMAQDLSIEESFNQISDTLAVVNINGTNAGVLVSDKGIVLIDPAINEENKQGFLKQVQGLSGETLKYVVNTHGHLDHSRGNKIFSTLGASILTSTSASYSSAHTELIFDSGLLLDLDSHQLRAFNVTSHTHDDWMVYLPEENTIFTGDVFTNNGHPTFYSGGLTGQKQAINQILSVANEETRIVPGHGAIAGIEDVRKYMANTTELYNQVRSLYEAGSSAEQIQADPKYQEAMLRFNTDDDEGFLNRKDVGRFVSQLISSAFIKAQRISEEASQRIIGRYALRDRSVIQVLLEDGRYYARKRGEFLLELIPQSDTEFHVRASLDGVARFIPNSKNTKIRQLELDLEGTNYLAKKQRR